MTHAIEVENLTKYYDKFLAVDHIDFAVAQGEIFGFLGPNRKLIFCELGLSPDASVQR